MSNENNAGRKEKLTDRELADILFYCKCLASMVSTTDAERYYGFEFDGAITDTLGRLSAIYDQDEDITEFKEDAFYGEIFNRMLADANAVLNEN